MALWLKTDANELVCLYAPGLGVLAVRDKLDIKTPVTDEPPEFWVAAGNTPLFGVETRAEASDILCALAHLTAAITPTTLMRIALPEVHERPAAYAAAPSPPAFFHTLSGSLVDLRGGGRIRIEVAPCVGKDVGPGECVPEYHLRAGHVTLAKTPNVTTAEAWMYGLGVRLGALGRDDLRLVAVEHRCAVCGHLPLPGEDVADHIDECTSCRRTAAHVNGLDVYCDGCGKRGRLEE